MHKRVKGIAAGVVLLLAIVPVSSAFAHDGSDDGGDQGEVEFFGTVDQLPLDGYVGDWTISGQVVHVTDATEIDAADDEADDEDDGDVQEVDGVIAVGSTVKVEGFVGVDGLVTAEEISDDDDAVTDDGDISLTGRVQRALHHTGTLRLAGHKVRVTKHTRIVRHGHRLVRGARITVRGHWRRDGVIRARKISIRA